MQAHGTGPVVHRKKTSILILDDHAIFREAITTLIEASGTYIVSGHAANVDEFLKHLDAETFDLAIVDLALPGKSGLEALYSLKRRQLKTRSLVLTMYEDDRRCLQALKAGALAYLDKTISSKTLFDALDRVSHGERFVSERYRHLSWPLTIEESVEPESNDPLLSLSKREREIFFFIAHGLPNRIIAERLFISPRTVETHRARVIQKLGVQSTADLVRYALKHNLVA